MSILRFQFTALGETRDQALEELDAAVRASLTHVGGEPWMITQDEVQKIPVKADLNDPASYAYVARQEVLFVGPTVLGDKPSFRDGFRPQSDGDFLGGL